MDTYLKELESNLSPALTKFKDEIRGIRTNRPSVELVEGIKVQTYGQTMDIKQLGSISVGAQREIVISLWDKEVIQSVMKAIQDAEIGLSAQNDGLVIRCFLPALSEERRQEFVKIVKRLSEDARIQVRAKRDETMKKLKAAEDSGGLGKDAMFKAKENAQKIVDTANADIEKHLEAKIKELGE